MWSDVIRKDTKETSKHRRSTRLKNVEIENSMSRPQIGKMPKKSRVERRRGKAAKEELKQRSCRKRNMTTQLRWEERSKKDLEKQMDKWLGGQVCKKRLDVTSITTAGLTSLPKGYNSPYARIHHYNNNINNFYGA